MLKELIGIRNARLLACDADEEISVMEEKLIAGMHLTSFPGHVGGGKSGLVSTVCTCAKNTMHPSSVSSN